MLLAELCCDGGSTVRVDASSDRALAHRSLLQGNSQAFSTQGSRFLKM
ncbi:hypothetical protein HMPREF0970_00555 [Schaalia odontolytica F0309]|uniref:Uncharacterized protein n=1 Tax=Schaalia odontolytica F0309 TaxID=649742 RepID=D4TX98_9ACTO|nr:hypothetical protein HMPREF0970_00555 [Schaalia odontolytica F0309]